MTTDVSPRPAAWRGAELAGRRDWVYELTADEVERAVRRRGGGPPRPACRSTSCVGTQVPLPMLSPVIDGWADELDAGRGFVLVRGVPVDELGEAGAAIAYVALGVHLGVPVSQNAAGDLLGHVRDDGSDPDDPTVRRYRTRLAQPFHVDGSDVVGLLCLQPAKSGGLSQIVSSVTVSRRWPDVVPTSSGCCRSRGTSIATARSGPASGRGSRCRSCRGCRSGSGSSICAGTSTRRRAIRTCRGSPTPRSELLDLIDAVGAGPRAAPGHGLRAGRHPVAGQPHDPALAHGLRGYDDPARRRHLLRLWLTLHRNVVDGTGIGWDPGQDARTNRPPGPCREARSASTRPRISSRMGRTAATSWPAGSSSSQSS